MIVSLNTLAVISENHTLPIEMEGKFLGVETCGSSECHGSAERWRNATVLMKERLIWNSSRHASAYDSLKSELGRKITRNSTTERRKYKTVLELSFYLRTRLAKG